MDRIQQFQSSVKVGDLVTINTNGNFLPLVRSGTRWSPGSKTRKVKRGEPLMIVVDTATPMWYNDGDDDIDSMSDVHEVIVFATASASFFGLGRSMLGRY